MAVRRTFRLLTSSQPSGWNLQRQVMRQVCILFRWEPKKVCGVSVCQKSDGICIQGWEVIHVHIMRRGAAANLNAHCDTLRRLREAIRGDEAWTTGCVPSTTMPTYTQHGTNKYLCGRFPGKFWAIQPIVLTLPNIIIICFGRPGRTWLVADSTTSSQWKRHFVIDCECSRLISQTKEYELVPRWVDLLICPGIILKMIFRRKY
jgi:hypothetical protein